MGMLIIVLRALHILGGVFWAGSVILLYGFVTPAVRATQPESGRFVQYLTGRTGLSGWLTAASVACMLAGLALYAPISGQFDRDWLRSSRGVVLSVGALIGLLAGLEGLFLSGPAGRRLGAIGRQVAAAGGTPTPEQAGAMAALQEKLFRSGTRAAWMLALAAVLMSIARYI